jgi:exodeoxyribonuclease V alpha subunit
MLQRNLLYTGITRGKRLVVLVGPKKAITIAVRNVAGRRRWSKLREWLTVITCGHNFCRETAGQASSIGSGCGA